MPDTVLTQLKSLRDGVAQELRMDPRYRTLQALDKSIAEITSVLASAGLLPAPTPGTSLTARLNGLGPSADPLADPAALAAEGGPRETSVGLPSSGLPPARPLDPAPPAGPKGPTPGFKGGTVGTQPVVPETTKPSMLKPVAEIAAVAALAGGVLAEAMHEEHKAHPAKAEAGAHEAPLQETPEDDEADEHAGAALGDDHGAGADPDSAEGDHDEAAVDEADEAEAHGHEAHGQAAHEREPESHDPHAAALAEADGEAADLEAADLEGGDLEGGDLEGEDLDGEDLKNGHAAAHPAAAEGDAPAIHGKFGRAPGEAADAAGTSHAGAEEDAAAEEEGGAEDEAAVVPKGKAGGYVPMAAREGAPQYAPSIAVKFGKLPNKVDLRPLMTPIEDQGQTSSCVANAVAGAYEYWIKKASKKDQPVSRLFVYYNARWRDNSQDKDEGSVIQLAMEGLQKFGACAESVWPFDPHLILKKPGADAYQDGAPYRVHDMAQVPLKLEAWKQALAEGKPIIFGIELFDSFDECTKRGGVVPMPAPDDIARKKHSGHSMCAVGYSESEKVFIIRNSWGPDFGDKGYCYMPYDYILNPKFNDADCWVFVPKVPSQPPRETWLDDTTPITNGGKGVDFAIQPYRVEDYEKIAVDLFAAIRRPWNPTVVAEYGEYVSAVGKNLFSELERFDVKTFLETTAILAGVGVTAEVLSSEFSESSSSESSSLSESESASESESEEDAEEDAEQDDDDAADDAEDGLDEADAEDDAEEDSAEDDDAEDEAEDDEADAEEDEEADDADEDSTEEAEDDAEDGDEADESDEDAEAEDDAEDDAEDEDDADSGDDDAGGDDAGGDDEE